VRWTASLLAPVVLIVAACGGTGDADPYAPLHQSARQEIPGTFGYDLLPVDGFRSEVDPLRAWRDLPGAEPGADVAVTLAEVRDPSGRADWGPSWVYFTNDLCYFTAKGDFVSPARSGEGDGCTRQNVLVQVVDATTGEFRAVFEAYDADLTWLPHRAGTPDQVPGATRFQ
jgi:hypothetical protein